MVQGNQNRHRDELPEIEENGDGFAGPDATAASGRARLGLRSHKREGLSCLHA
ncbi:hypothetical protein D779_1401 [Imhoffiella purpurea]|uniref:Uncharacterized protein n=1 Tax=Imhoffiella purpurea TaxID=1249627 RepID=W9VHB7_9GAMM|nr:hypothetical protein D779_1401 [Imhoffiella purpurea]